MRPLQGERPLRISADQESTATLAQIKFEDVPTYPAPENTELSCPRERSLFRVAPCRDIPMERQSAMPGHPQPAYTPIRPNCDAVPRRPGATALLRAGAVEMHYQPILDLALNTVRKVEALARLRDEERLLMPGEFLPELDDEGLYELFVLGLDTALRDRNHWLMHGLTLDISVNLPPGALTDARYVDATSQALARHACPPGALTLEILESRAIGDAALAVTLFRRFSQLGVMMAEDDLGSGHSSLTRLRELDFNWIKIDRSIVNLTGGDDMEVLQFVYQLTRLGHGLGKAVIVEGVEDTSLIEAIRILGADAAQGYGIARPMPADAILAGLSTRESPTVVAEPASMLPRLARLLLVEDQLQACQRQLAAISPSPRPSRCSFDGGLPHDGAAADLRCDTCQRERLAEDIDAIYPATAGRDDSTRKLIDLALRHGVRSAAYRQARRRFTAAR